MLETVFSIASLIAIAGWVGLAAAVLCSPGKTRDWLLLIAGRWIPIGLCVTYAIVLWRYWGSAPGGGFSSLGAVITLFAAPGKVLGGWLHFLAFDLLVGRWLVDHAFAAGRTRLPLIVALPATFMNGPLGVLLYVVAHASCVAAQLSIKRR